MIERYFISDIRSRLKKQAENMGLKGQQALDIINETKNTVKEVLSAELKNGNYSSVISFLKSYTLKAGQDILLDKIIQRVVGRLIIRFGLPHAIALNVAMIIVPFILKRLGKKALESGKFQDLFNTLGLTDKIEKFTVLKNQVKSKFSFGSNAAA